MKLEPVAPEHAPAIQQLAADPAVIATTNLPDPYPAHGAEEWIRFVRRRQAVGAEYAFAMVDDAAGARVVGVCGLVEVSGGEAEMGYWVGRPYWNGGHATAAGRLLVAYAFEKLELDRLRAHPLMRNRASRRVLEKLGFTLEGLRPNPYPRWHPLDYLATYRLTAAQWRARP